MLIYGEGGYLFIYGSDSLYIKEIICDKINSIIGVNVSNIIIKSKNPIYGDYTIPCHLISRIIEKPLSLIMQEFKTKLKHEIFENVECADSYINIYIKRKYIYLNTVDRILNQNNKRMLPKTKNFIVHSAVDYLNNEINLVVSEAIYRIMEYGGYKGCQLLSIYDEASMIYENNIFNKKPNYLNIGSLKNEFIEIISQNKKMYKTIEAYGEKILIIPLAEYDLAPLVLCKNNKFIFNKSIDYLPLKYIEKKYMNCRIINITKRKDAQHLKKIEACLKGTNSCINSKFNIFLTGKLITLNMDRNYSILKTIQKKNMKYKKGINNFSKLPVDIILKNSFIVECLYNAHEKNIYIDLKKILEDKTNNYMLIQNIYFYLKSKVILLKDVTMDYEYLNEAKYYNILRHIYEFDSIIQESIDCINPRLLIDFCLKLAKDLYVFTDNLCDEFKQLIEMALVIINKSMELIGIELK